MDSYVNNISLQLELLLWVSGESCINIASEWMPAIFIYKVWGPWCIVLLCETLQVQTLQI